MAIYKQTILLTFIQAILVSRTIYGDCPWKDGALPTVENGYLSNATNLKLYSDNTATGYFEIKCRSGYRLDSTIGSRITCLESGQWSKPLPKCISMGFCLIQPLFDFIQSSNGIQVDRSQSFIYTNGLNDTVAIGGSNITLQCRSGYANIGGSLTITCEENNNWTTFPNCVSTSNETTTKPPVRCPYNDSVLQFENGYVSKSNNLLIYTDDTATGSVTVSCYSGYKMDSVSGGVFSCNAGVWSSRPYCTKTARCSFQQLENNINNATLNRGLNIDSQRLLTDGKDENGILIGSYILFRCGSDYTNIDNNLNVTCMENGEWSSFPKCSSKDGSPPSGQCLWQNGSLPTVENGYRSNVDHLRAYTNGYATGYYDIQCYTGYKLDPTIGGRISCLESNVWSSPLPKCIPGGFCVLKDLFDFIQTNDGIDIDGAKNYVYTNGIDDSKALEGSNITVRCRDGYKLLSGNLLVQCQSSNTWTTFPQCVLMTTPKQSSLETTMDPSSRRCPYNETSWNFPNGYLSNTTNLLLYSDKTAKGSVQIGCSSGYVIDSISGGIYQCSEGIWSPRPYCTKTNRCSLSQIQNFVGDPTLTRGLEISSQNITKNKDETDSVLIGSKIIFMCKNGYSNSDGNLQVICQDNGQWTRFPTCIPDPTTTTTTK